MNPLQEVLLLAAQMLEYRVEKQKYSVLGELDVAVEFAIILEGKCFAESQPGLS